MKTDASVASKFALIFAKLTHQFHSNSKSHTCELFWLLVILLLPLGTWIFLCWDWPARLGFFSDDWMILLHPFVGTAQAFHDIFQIVATRPASAPFIWLAQLIVDWSPARSQYLNAAMLLVTAASVGTLAATVVSMCNVSRKAAFIGACVATTIFISFPSNIGTYAWGTGVVAAVPATPLFCLAVSFLLRAEYDNRRLCIGLFLAVLSHLSYEAFYFQEITFIIATWTVANRQYNRATWRLLFIVIALNISCLLFNRFMPGGIPKSFHWDAFATFIGGYRRIFGSFYYATREHVSAIRLSSIGTALFGLICLSRIAGPSRSLIAVIALIGGAAAAGLLYAMAGYGLAFEGPSARIAIVVATYFSLAIGVAAAAAWSIRAQNPWLALAFSFCAMVLLIGVTASARSRVGEWAETWSYELARLSRLPESFTIEDGLARTFLAIEDRPSSTVEPATAPWEISGAVVWAAYNRSATQNRRTIVSQWEGLQTSFWFATPHNWFARWDGKRFEQGPCGSPNATYHKQSSELWIWKTMGSEMIKVDAPWGIECR